MCAFCDKGCSIHGDHPDDCKGFKCMYYEMEEVSLKFRPDKCRVIFEKLSPTIILGTLDPKYTISDDMKRQVNDFNKQGYSVVVKTLSKKEPLLRLAPNHTHKLIVREYVNLVKKWQPTELT